MIEVDGAMGGGSVVRISTGLAAGMGEPVKVENIREKRPEPGLKPQHVAGVRAVAELCDADTTGLEIGSRELEFVPGEGRGGEARIEIPTAGSVGLALQPVQIASAAWEDEVKVTVDGGATAGKWAPPVPYIQAVLLPLLRSQGFEASIDVRRHGFYPEGGALVKASYGSGLKNLQIGEKVEIEGVTGMSIASGHLRDSEVAERQAGSARKHVKDFDPSLDVEIEEIYVESRSPGSMVLLKAETGGSVLGADAIGEKGKRSEKVGKEAGAAMVEILDSEAPLDAYASDQLVPYLGIAGGEIEVMEFTEHVESSIDVVETVTGKEVEREGRKLRVT